MSIVCVVGDTHVGSTTALAPPKFEIHAGRKDETQLVEYNALQQWLYRCWQDYWTTALTMAGVRGKDRKHRLFIFHLGDCIDGEHHHSPQVMPEVADQVTAFHDLFRPLAALADGTWLTYGTGAHNGGNGEVEMGIGERLNIHHGYWFSLSIDGIVFDIAHPGRSAQREWTSAAAGVAAEVAADYRRNGKQPPHYVLRGHTHTVDESGLKIPDTRAIMIPCWQLKTFYANQKFPNQKYSHIGGVIIDTDNPDNPRILRYTPPGGFIKTEVI